MAELSISLPAPGTTSVYTFKEPFRSYLKNNHRFNTDGVRMKIVSIININDNIRTDLVDPYTTLYSPVGVSESDYKQDIIDNVPLVTFTFTDADDIIQYFRVPASYIADVSSIGNVDYIHKTLVLDLGLLPVDLNVADMLKDVLPTLVKNITGSTGPLGSSEPKLYEVGLGAIVTKSSDEHESLEIIRTGYIDTTDTLEEVSNTYKQRLQDLLEQLDDAGILVNLDTYI